MKTALRFSALLLLTFLPMNSRTEEVQLIDTMVVRKMTVELTPLRYLTDNYQTFGDSTGVYIKIVSGLTIGEFENLLKAIETWLEYNKLFKK